MPHPSPFLRRVGGTDVISGSVSFSRKPNPFVNIGSECLPPTLRKNGEGWGTPAWIVSARSEPIYFRPSTR